MRNGIWICVFAGVFALGPGSAAADTMKVQNSETSLSPTAVSDIGGYIGERMKLTDKNRLSTFDIDDIVKMVETPTYRQWFWIGEQPGKWLEASILTSIATDDPHLRTEAQQILSRMIAAQEESGYLGITDPAVRTAEKPLRGMDPYELYFTLHALLSAYEDWGSQPALHAASRLGDYFVDHIGPGKAEFSSKQVEPGHTAISGHAAHQSLEGTLLIDPMMRLYADTGDAKYLQWVQWVVSNIDRWSEHDTFSNLDKVADGTMTLDQVQPYVHAHTFHMNFLGFLRLYRATGDASLLRKVQGAWNDIAARQMYITGGVSVGEHYEGGHNLPITGSVVETCASMSWLELNQSLLEITGDTKYADAMEKLMWNHLFAAETCDGDAFKYHTALDGSKPVGYFRTPDCCNSSGPRIVSQLPQFIYASGNGAIYVNQFITSTAKFPLDSSTTVTLKQTTDYPASGEIHLELAIDKPATFTVNIRLPAWCDAPALKVNGEAIENLKPGSYASIPRQWQNGDRLDLSLPMQIKWIAGSYTTRNLWALQRGPVVYALDSAWFSQPPELMHGIADGPAALGGAQIDPTKVPTPAASASAPADAIGPAFQIALKSLSGSALVGTMIPFANIGTWYRTNAAHPGRNAAAYRYAVWIAAADSPAFARALATADYRKNLEARALDIVTPDADNDHRPRGMNTGTGEFNGRYFRDAPNSGWFSWSMTVAADKPLSLLCTYWGDEDYARTFDILIDGQKIATQSLHHDKPGEFFDVEYPIPPEFTQGKTRVTVRFQAHPGNIAGGVFGAAIVTGAR